MKKLLLFLFIAGFIRAQTEQPAPYGAIPSKQHLEWHSMEYYAFIHFNMNTFTGKEWGEGTEPEDAFNPTELDCRQWARTVKEAGMMGIIITAKHHDGFCLWPSKYSTHTVRESKWRNGKGDVLKELSAACKEYGLKFGIYISPWDRNHPDYGTDKYNNAFINTLKEVLTNYGKIFEVWFDGANGEGPNGKKQVYDWPAFFKTVRKCQPDALIFGPVSPDIRWVGNEDGYANETNWATMDKNMTEHTAGQDGLNRGTEGGNAWIPSEADVSIRPGWYYHKEQDSKVKSLNKLVDIYFASVGRGSNLLLNIPPDGRGLINENDIKALREFKKYLSASFKTNLCAGAKATAANTRGNSSRFSPAFVIDNGKNTFWTTDDSVKSASVEIDFCKTVNINCVELQEYIALGQRVKSFSVEAFVNNNWIEITKGTTIGHKRLLRFPEIKTEKIRVNILDSKAAPVIANIAAYKTKELVALPLIIRGKKGVVLIKTESPQSLVYYTIDGKEPSVKSLPYTKPFEFKNNGVVKAKVFTGDLSKSSSVATVEFGASKEKWKIISVDDEHKEFKAEHAIDDSPYTFWHTHWAGDFKKHPHEIIVDFGEELPLSGFTYLPRQDGNNSGNITEYELFLGVDNANWKNIILNAKFENVVNNSGMQRVPFAKTINARYLKLITKGDANNNGWINAAEIGVITK